MLLSLADNIGTFEDSEITTSSARMRVTISGLKPLITCSTLEFYNGDEVNAELVYEKLEKQYSICFCLDHDAKDCAQSVDQRKQTEKLPQRRTEEPINQPPRVDLER
ncbi:unnamed protein product [Arabis nemorensis]|uniref:Zinc knuckle CX2CX4HX4C domain-containing protein n=1 Tax=Arabis nemorensis TaxID=586526 RepID=A0A565CNG4_9BRAS|nr:unnamed protein product [Arabis nemorensis]